MLHHPNISPIAISLGPIKVHWYGIMYLIGFTAGWWLARRRARTPGSTWTGLDIDDLIFYCALGVIVGGRLGWCLIYGREVIAEHWYNLFRIWDGGMSFHGGLTGVICAAILLARAKGKNVADVFDFLAPLPGIGLFAGRMGNFINNELWGRPTDLPWAFGVPDENGVLVGRHPSQLYEGLLEGLLLFAVLWWFTSKPRPRLAPTGLFFILYGCGRFVVEWVRLPDANIGYLAHTGWLTMGMLLTAPMILIGALVMVFAYRRAQITGNFTKVTA
jgi:phosphatidylglycerol:prolipoprotein diacylglycerol transferase